MTAREMQNAFEHGVNRRDNELIVESHVVFHWINEAIDRFFLTRYNGNNRAGTGAEETQKRVEDLRTLVTESVLAAETDFSSILPGSYMITLPNDYRIKLSEGAVIEYVDPSSGDFQMRTVGVTETTSDTLFQKLSNPFSEHNLVYGEAKPLRLFKEDKIQLFTDGNYVITTYLLRYLRNPAKVGLGPNESDCDLPESSHTEIVDLAVNLFLENVGDPRYPTNKSELIMNE